MNVLVDTSVWIRFLMKRSTGVSDLQTLLLRQEVSGHELVFGELLIGDIGGRSTLLQDHDELPRAPMVPHEEVVKFVENHALQGRGVGWVDVHLLASAMVAGMLFWTTDARLAQIASEFGVDYRPADQAVDVPGEAG